MQYLSVNAELYMLLSNEEMNSRLESPLNLINRLRNASVKNSEASGKSAVIMPARTRDRVSIASLPPSVDELVDSIDNKLASNQVAEKANAILLASMNELAVRLPEANSPKVLSDIASNMNRIIATANEERHAQRGVNNIQVMIYAPEVKQENDFDFIDVSDTAE